MPDDLTIQLPMGDPIALGYQFYAYPLAIQATDERTTDWILSNYIQLEYDKRGWDTDVPFTFYLYDYAESPWLEVVRGTRRWFSSSDIRDVVRAGLAKGYYTYTIVDEYHIPDRRWHGSRHLMHDILVRGVDDRAGTFTVLGFDGRMQFRSTRVGQEELARAYTSLDHLEIGNAPVLGYRLRTQPNFGYPPVEYDLNLGLIRISLDEYLRSLDTSEHFQVLRKPRPCVYGVDCYQYLEEFIRLYAARDIDYDVRHLHVLWEHKRLMTARIRRLADFLGPLEYFQAEAERIEATARTLRNTMMRDQLRGGGHGREYLDKSLRMLHTIRDAEVDMLSKLLPRLGG